jgi:hypothetical protein
MYTWVESGMRTANSRNFTFKGAMGVHWHIRVVSRCRSLQCDFCWIRRLCWSVSSQRQCPGTPMESDCLAFFDGGPASCTVSSALSSLASTLVRRRFKAGWIGAVGFAGPAVVVEASCCPIGWEYREWSPTAWSRTESTIQDTLKIWMAAGGDAAL